MATPPPATTGWDSQPRSGASRPEGEPRTRSARRLNPGFEAQPVRGGLRPQRTGWDSNPRGREPTRFPIVRLKPLGHPSEQLWPLHAGEPLKEARPFDRSRKLPEAKSETIRSTSGEDASPPKPQPCVRRPVAYRARCTCTGWDSQPRSGVSRPEGEARMRSTAASTLGSNHAPCDGGQSPQAEGVGFEPTRPSRVNALAGRRLKPLGHPSEIAPPGIEPGLF